MCLRLSIFHLLAVMNSTIPIKRIVTLLLFQKKTKFLHKGTIIFWRSAIHFLESDIYFSVKDIQFSLSDKIDRSRCIIFILASYVILLLCFIIIHESIRRELIGSSFVLCME